MMSKAIFSYQLKCLPVLLGIFLVLVSYTGYIAAAPPAVAGEKGLPQYLESELTLIKDMLSLNAQKLDALSAQLSGVESDLKVEIALARDEITADMDLLSLDIGEALLILNAPEKDIELSTEVCFDLGATWDWAYTGKISGGVGIELGLAGEAGVELTMPGLIPLPTPIPGAPIATLPITPSVAAGISNTICVSVPLYAVASNDHWVADFDTTEFDALIADVARPAQFLLPGLAHAYGQVMPTPEEAIGFLTDGLALFDPNQANASMTTSLSTGMGADKIVLLSNGMRVNQAVLFAATASHDDMMTGSPLLRNIMETDSIGDALSDPCGFAVSFGLPGATAVAAQCTAVHDLIWDVVDPLCLLDWAIDHCP